MKTEPVGHAPRTESKHHKIYRILVDEIASGKFIALGSFPSERALMRRFNVARETIRLTMHELQKKGLVFSLQGRGTFISANKGGASQRKANPPSCRKIGLLISGSHYTEIFARICRELKHRTAEHGMELMIGDVSDQDVRKMGKATCEMARRMVKEGVAGIILQPLEYGSDCLRQNDEILSIIEKARIPLVLIDSDVDTTRQDRSYDIVSIDNLAAGASVAEHLYACGARRIRFLIHDCLAESVRMRLAGCRFYSNELDGPLSLHVDPADVKAIRDILFADPEIDAFVCQNDVAATKLIGSLKQMGVRVPEDVRVAGFDDVSLAACFKPTLTTVHQPCEKIAKQALHLLMKRIERPDRTPCRHLLHAPLVVRQSSVL